jgi:hypothetical protein
MSFLNQYVKISSLNKQVNMNKGVTVKVWKLEFNDRELRPMLIKYTY